MQEPTVQQMPSPWGQEDSPQQGPNVRWWFDDTETKHLNLDAAQTEKIYRSIKEVGEDEETVLRLKMANATSYFRRKAGAVLVDQVALQMMADIYEARVVEKAKFDQQGMALAKLTAANFCEIGANAIYITPAGRQFVDRIQDA